MSKYLEEMAALNEAWEVFNERTPELHEQRGVPSHVPLVARPGDQELMDYLEEGLALQARDRAFFEKYRQPGIDPHTID